jgi:hypothetical protein
MTSTIAGATDTAADSDDSIPFIHHFIGGVRT